MEQRESRNRPTYSQPILAKEQKQHNGKKMVFSKMELKQLDIDMQKNEFRHRPYTFHKH